MFKRLMGIGITFGMAALTSPAAAQSCAARDAVIGKLQEKYAEQLTAGGLQLMHRGPSMIELWASAETGTFTVLLTDANGVSCIVAAGTDYFQATPVPRKTDIPS